MNGSFDAQRFEKILEGPEGVERYGDGNKKVYRLGAWRNRWEHWSNFVMELEIEGADMPYARTTDEYEWWQKFEPYIQQILDGTLRFGDATDVTTPSMVEGIDNAYFYRHWTGWSKDMCFEKRMRLPFFVFGGWHNVELFATPTATRGTLYHPVSPLWSQTVEVAQVYLVPMPWIVEYCARYSTTVGALTLQMFENIGVRKYTEESLPVMLATARWGTRAKEFADPRLRRTNGP